MSLTRITSDGITDAAIVNADINASAAIAGTKIDPNFGTQDVTSRYVYANDIFLGDVSPELRFTDSDNNPDYRIRLNSGILDFYDITNTTSRMSIQADGHIDIAGNLDVGAGLDVTGNITVTGTVDGVDIAALSSTVSGLSNTTINNNADNRVITGSGTANTLNGEASLTFDGTRILDITSSSGGFFRGTDSDGGVGLLEMGNGDVALQADTGNAINNSKIHFFVDNTERMRIDSSGNVGIGTTSPESKFAIKASSGSADLFSISDIAVPTSGDEYGVAMIKSNAAAFMASITGYNSNAKGVRIYVNGGSTGRTSFRIDHAAGNKFMIDGGGLVGIGHDTPSSFSSAANDLVINGSNAGMTISTAATETGSIFFADGTGSASQGRIRYDHSDDHMHFSTATNERMRIDSSGTIFSFSPDDTTPNIKFRSDDTNWFGSLNQSVEGGTISTFLSTGGDWSANGSTYSATKSIASFETRAIVLHPQFNNGGGKVAFLQKPAGSTTTDGTVTEILKIDNDGIKFGSDTATANALHDYEEGSFTPQFDGLSNTPAYAARSGRYTKIGRLVHITGIIQTGGTNPTFSSTSNPLKLTGLPFAGFGVMYFVSLGNVSHQSWQCFGSGNNEGNYSSGDIDFMNCQMEHNTSNMIFIMGKGGNSRAKVRNASMHNSGAIITFELSYTVQ